MEISSLIFRLLSRVSTFGKYVILHMEPMRQLIIWQKKMSLKELIEYSWGVFLTIVLSGISSLVV
jgi:hypothetical protein